VPYRWNDRGACTGSSSPSRATASANDGACALSAAADRKPSTGLGDPDWRISICDRRSGEGAMLCRDSRLGQYQLKDLPFHRIQGLREHENRRVYVRDGCDQPGNARLKERETSLRSIKPSGCYGPNKGVAVAVGRSRADRDFRFSPVIPTCVRTPGRYRGNVGTAHRYHSSSSR